MANFTVDTKIENWLKQRGVRYDYREGVRMEELMPNWFLVNQGRHDSAPKDDSLIEKYAGAMDNGSLFPSPIAAKTAQGLEVLDGCQRLCAAELCGQTMFNAYIVKTDNPVIRASIRVCANSILNGTSPSQDWTISKIVDVLYEQHSLSVVDCAQWSGQPEKKIQIEVDSRDFARWLRVHGVDTAKKPANQKLFLAAGARLAPLLTRAKLTKELPTLVRQLQSVKANNDEAIHMLTECLDVQQAKGVELAQQVGSKIRSVFERPEIQARMSGPRSLHPVDNVVRAMASALTTMRSAAGDNHHADADQGKQIIDMLEQMRRFAKRIVPKHDWQAMEETFAAVPA